MQAIATEAIQVNVNAMAALVLGGLMLSGITALIGVLLKTRKQTGELWDAHLGPRAIDDDGIPRWYMPERRFLAIAERIDQSIHDVRHEITELVAVNRELLQEMKVEREVAARAREQEGG